MKGPTPGSVTPLGPRKPKSHAASTLRYVPGSKTIALTTMASTFPGSVVLRTRGANTHASIFHCIGKLVCVLLHGFGASAKTNFAS